METAWKAQKLQLAGEAALPPLAGHLDPLPNMMATSIYFSPFVCLIPSLPGCSWAQGRGPPAGQWDNGASSLGELHGSLRLFSRYSLLPRPAPGGSTDFNLQMSETHPRIMINKQRRCPLPWQML